MDIYRDIILDHYKHPRNFGTLPTYTHRAQAANVTCGDSITVEFMLNRSGKVADVRFIGEGCAISQAAASLLTEKIKNMKTATIMALVPDDVLSLLGTTLTPSRLKCALLPLETIKKAIHTKIT